jgi:hypothetical protein
MKMSMMFLPPAQEEALYDSVLLDVRRQRGLSVAVPLPCHLRNLPARGDDDAQWEWVTPLEDGQW